jgi:hypothetical protein
MANRYPKERWQRMKKGQESGPKLNVQDIHFLTGKRQSQQNLHATASTRLKHRHHMFKVSCSGASSSLHEFSVALFHQFLS